MIEHAQSTYAALLTNLMRLEIHPVLQFENGQDSLYLKMAEIIRIPFTP